jgi:hypothetical protein
VDVTDLRMTQPDERLAAIDDAPADARADGDINKRWQTNAITPPRFRKRGGVHVGTDSQRFPEFPGKHTAQIEVRPAQLRGLQHSTRRETW